MKTKCKIFTLLLNVVMQFAIAQVSVPNPQPPEVASINKFIDYPVDKSTGLPQINIPIYTLDVRGFQFPLSLSYHSGGIKVEEMASSVGLGWALNAGGTISRTIRGRPDEIGWHHYHGAYPAKTYPIAEGDTYTHYFTVANEYFGDSEPDIFYFSFNGYSGKFIFDKNGKAYTIPEQDIKIEATDYLTQFKITTPDGNQYIFKDRYKNYQNYNIPEATGWNLTQVVTNNRDVIDFEYVQQGYLLQTALNHPPGLVYANHKPNEGSITELTHNDHYTWAIKKIKSKLCNIEFNYKTTLREDYSNENSSSSTMYALDNIMVYSNYDNIYVKRINLKTSYFYSTTNQTYQSAGDYIRKRLRLDEVQESTPDNSQTLPAYIFSYNKYNFTSNGKLPHRLSYGQDMWGYYNGSDGNTGIWPTLTDPVNPTTVYITTTNNRAGDENYLKAYILDEIVFPTGAITDYEYEAIKSAGQVIGGLRIKNVKTYESLYSIPIQKSYSYETPQLISGRLQLTYLISESENASNYDQIQVPCTYTTQNSGITSIAMAFPYAGDAFTDVASQYIFHQKVIEHQINNGYIVSEYDVNTLAGETADFDNDYYPFTRSLPILTGGKLEKETVQDEVGNILKVTNFIYGSYTHNIISSTDAFKVFRPYCIQRFKSYFVSTGSSHIITKEEFVYPKNSIASSDVLHSITNYEYAGLPSIISQQTPLHNFLTKESTTGYDSKTHIKRYKYPIDYKYNLSSLTTSDILDDASLAISEMINRNMINSPIETIQSKMIGGAEYFIGAELNKYTKKTVFGSVDSTYIKPFESYQYKLLSPILYSSFFNSVINKSGNAFSFDYESNYDLRMRYSIYDNTGNLTSFSKAGKLTTYVSWGYYNELPISISGNGGYTTYTYKPLIGITSVTNPSGIATTYEYDSFNRLKFVKDRNGDILNYYNYNFKQ